MRIYDVVILGGGPAGLYTAINIEKNKKVAIIDCADRLGKKILVTGNGRCNITNDFVDKRYYNTKDVDKYFSQYDNNKTIKDFESMGLMTYSDSEGRRYPISNSANSVLDILLNQISNRKNIEVFTNCTVMQIAKNVENFAIICNNAEFSCKNLVVAIGSNNADKILQQLGVKYVAFTPSLVSLKTERNKGLAGIRVSDVEIKFQNFVERGEMLFKEDAISGIVVFNLSTVFSRNNLKSGCVLVNLLPNIEENMLIQTLKQNIKNNSSYSVVLLLEGFLHKALAKNITEKVLGKDKIVTDLTNSEIESIAKMIKSYKINVTGLSDNNQVNSGGVSLANLTNNLMYKDIQGLYFAGEIVDVDGVCGGYNLQWAWTSGKIVGESL